MYPSEFLKSFYNKYIDRQSRITFLSAIMIGFISHGFMLTNKFPNYDDIQCFVDDYGAGIESGRWMLFIIGNIVRKTIGNFSLPWFNGIICLVIIGIGSVLIVKIFNIRDEVLCFLTGALMISFPAVTGILFFMYTAIYYCLSILLSILAVYIYKEKRVGFIGSILVLTASLGIYQANFSVTAVLFLLLLLLECLSNKIDSKKTIKQMMKYFWILVGALILYLICARVFLAIKQTNFLSYQGIDNIGRLNLKDIPKLVAKSYRKYFELIYLPADGINPYWIIKGSILLLHILAGAILVFAVLKKRISMSIELVVCVAVFPLAVNLIYIMAPNSFVYATMLYSVVFIYLFIILILQIIKTKKDYFDRLAEWIGSGILIIVIFAQCQYNNVQYLAMSMQYEQAYSYFITMITEIKDCDGYQASMPVVFVGESINDLSFYYNDEFSYYNMGGRSQDLINIYSRNKFLKRYLGFNQDILENSEVWEEISIKNNMQLYPNDGSIKIIQETVVVKLGENK